MSQHSSIFDGDDGFDGDDDIDHSTSADAADEAAAPTRERRRSGCGIAGCLAVLVAAVVLVGGGYLVLTRGVDAIQEGLAGPEDYAGPGTGQVLVEVTEGQSGADIGATLKRQDVVESVEAFTDAYKGNERAASSGIQAGFYQLKRQMKADDAVAYMVDPEHLALDAVTIPEGFRVQQVIDRVVQQTDISRRAMDRALANGGADIDLPASARGNAEGYLFPATYPVSPKETAVSLLKQMVGQTVDEQRRLGMAAKAKELGYTPAEVLTMASILEYEGSREQDLAKIARVFYNRLDDGMPLQSDATVAYANGVSGTVWTTPAQRSNPSRYNTYRHPGLPPGPIGSPGATSLEAALAPADGDWLYFVPVNLETGETKFAATYAEHLRNVEQLRDWCAETDSPNCD